MATICLETLNCLGEMILLEEGNTQQLKHIGVTVLPKLIGQLLGIININNIKKYQHINCCQHPPNISKL